MGAAHFTHLLKEPAMAWGIVILCIVLGSFAALRPSGRAQDFRRSKNED